MKLIHQQGLISAAKPGISDGAVSPQSPQDPNSCSPCCCPEGDEELPPPAGVTNLTLFLFL